MYIFILLMQCLVSIGSVVKAQSMILESALKYEKSYVI